MNQSAACSCRVAHGLEHGARHWLAAWLVLLLASVSLAGVSVAQAEWYFAGQAGFAIAGTLQDSNVTSPTLGGPGGVTNARVSDLDLMNSGVYGAKAGYFSTARPWLGLETEVFLTQPNLRQQTIVGGVPGKPPFADTLPGSHINLTTWALNILVREPSLNENFQPYGGVGPALFIASSSTGNTSSTGVNPGVNFVAGARYFLTPQWAVFGEFKYDLATLKFNGINGDYSAQLFVFGVSFHLTPPISFTPKAQP